MCGHMASVMSSLDGPCIEGLVAERYNVGRHFYYEMRCDPGETEDIN